MNKGLKITLLAVGIVAAFVVGLLVGDNAFAYFDPGDGRGY